MGVSGVGKTTIGRLLADRLAWRFYDADDFHSADNIKKMSQGHALNDQDRESWLNVMVLCMQHLGDVGRDAVIACSALKQIYRDRLAAVSPDIQFVYLHADKELIYERLEQRRGHFMSSALLESQLETLETPSDALQIDAAIPPGQIVERIFNSLPISSD